MKTKNSTENPKTINELFDRKYGMSGSKARSKFEQKAEAFMVAELVKT
jgi:HTH-type transcriptional regulator / antitoxin HipB